MRKIRGPSAYIILFVFVFITLTPVQAHWVDDWLDNMQATESGPGYYEGQQRGYFTAGSLSARWKMTSDPLLTVMPPRIKSGCGGIDVFLGGLGFMNMDYLVAKLQNMLTAAPAVAFDIALKTLCSPCAETLKALNATSDMLNSLQMDDCKMTKGVLTYAADKMGLYDGQSQLRSNAEAEFSLTQGLTANYGEMSKQWGKVASSWSDWASKIMSGNPPAAGESNPSVSDTEMTKDCPVSLKAILFPQSDKSSLLANFIENYKDYYGSDFGGNINSFSRVIRGLIGDVIVELKDSGESGKKTYSYKYIPPCDNSRMVDAFYTGQFYERSDSGGGCQLATIQNASMDRFVGERLQRIAGRIQNKQTIDDNDQYKLATFISTLPAPAYLMLKTAAMSNSLDIFLAQAQGPMAKAYTYNMVLDLNGKVSLILAQAISAIEHNKTSKNKCLTEIGNEGVASMARLTTKLNELQQQAMSEYANSLQENNSMIEFAQRYEEFNRQAVAQLSKVLGPLPAKRAIGGGT